MDKLKILKQLKIEEKIKWTAGNNMWFMLGNERLGLEEILVADGPHGVRVYKKRPGHAALQLSEMQESTLFPSAAAMASTFNEDLIYLVGKTIGEECNNFGVDVLLAPGMNLKRSPLGGRNFEYYSEDPYLTGRMAVNFINGVQDQGVGTCIKHFALNEQENQRRFVNTIVDERTMHELYLKPFKMAIDEAKPWTLMSSYNQVLNHYSSESTLLLKDILRDKWQFDGTIISDWGAAQDKVKAIKNGLNIEMPGPSEFSQDVINAVANKELTEEELDKSLLPLLDLYEKVMKNTNKGKETDLARNHKLAQAVAEEAIVLLENDGILPIQGKPKLAVIGTFAKVPRVNGGGSATLKPFILENPLEELEKQFDCTFAQGYDEDNTNEALLKEVENAIEDADLVVYFTGTTENLETEGKDREHMNLPEGHIEVFNQIKHHKKPNIVILNNGSSLNVTPLIGHTNAIVESWFLGGANAKALVNILLGHVNPSGKLSETFPIRIEHTPQYPTFPSKEDTVNYSGDIINLGYRYYTTHTYPVRYPFGYGLSYTTFKYSDLVLDKKELTDTDTLQIQVDVTNTGTLSGKETVQFYLHDVDSYLPRPVRELVAFKKVELDPGETKTVSVTLTKEAFSVYDKYTESFKVESGDFVIEVGKNVETIECSETVHYQSSTPFITHLTLGHPLKTFFIHKEKQTKALLDKYREFPWYEIEEPALRVLKRVQKEFSISDTNFQTLLNDLLK